MMNTGLDKIKMTKEEKNLLLQDLCARLPYGVKVNAPFTTNKNENAKGYKINSIKFGVVEWTPILFGEKKQRSSIIIEAFSEKFNQICSIDIELNNNIERVKPYLFPLSNMTDEQKEKYNKLNGYELGCFPSTEEALDYLIENHFDYRYLIDKGLALDATNKNIY